MVSSLREFRKVSGKAIWVRWATLDELERLRREGESLDDAIQKLLRFHNRLRAPGETSSREEVLA